MIPSIVKLHHDPVTDMPFDPGGHGHDSPPTQEDGAKSSQLSTSPSDDTFAGTNQKFFTNPNQKSSLTFHPSDLVGHTFLLDSQEDGQWFRTRIIKVIEDYDAKLHNQSERFKFRCSINDDQYEEILTYNEILNYIEQQDDDGTKVWRFRHITAHEGPLKPSDPTYKGSKYNIMIEWESGEITSKPLTIIAADDPVTCEIYAKENGLLDLDGWKRFKGIAK